MARRHCSGPGAAVAPVPVRILILVAALFLPLALAAAAPPARAQSIRQELIIQKAEEDRILQQQIGGLQSEQIVNEVINLTDRQMNVRQSVYGEVLQESLNAKQSRQFINRVVEPFGKPGLTPP